EASAATDLASAGSSGTVDRWNDDVPRLDRSGSKLDVAGPSHPRQPAPSSADRGRAASASDVASGNGHAHRTTELGGVRVLVVDDQPDAREVIATILRRAGAEVGTAGSAQEALENFWKTRPDILVSDVAMPDRDGFDLIRTLRELPESEGGKTPAIAL